MLKVNKLRERQMLTLEEAATIFSAQVIRQGGGWGELDGVPIYGCMKEHGRCERPWQIHSIGGLR